MDTSGHSGGLPCTTLRQGCSSRQLSRRRGMSNRQILLYFAWSRPGETEAPLTVIEDRFPGIFELRRLFYPRFEQLSDAARIDQGIAGFLDHIQKPNFAAFTELAGAQT